VTTPQVRIPVQPDKTGGYVLGVSSGLAMTGGSDPSGVMSGGFMFANRLLSGSLITKEVRSERISVKTGSTFLTEFATGRQET